MFYQECRTRYLGRSKIQTDAAIKEVIRLDVLHMFNFTPYYEPSLT